MQIDFIYDTSVLKAPFGFFQGLAAAAKIINAAILNPITIAIGIGYGEDHGDVLSGNTLGEAQPAFGLLLPYSQISGYLLQAARVNGTTTSLPAIDPSGGAGFFVGAPQLIAWDVIPRPATQIDGYAGFSSTLPFTYDPTHGVAAGTYDFVGLALHELTHALGRYLTAAYLTPMSLFGYAANGLLDTNIGDARYLSTDGGKTKLANFDTILDPSDFAPNSPADAFNATIPAGTVLAWSTLDTQTLTALGYRTNLTARPPPPSFIVRDTVTGQKSTSAGDIYTGAAAGITRAFVAATSDATTITASAGNVAITGGSGNDTITAAYAAGHNILDGGAGSNRLVGSGNPAAVDTFIVNVAGATGPTWNTIVNMHKGDGLTVLGLTQTDFSLKWTNGQGAIGAGALTLVAAKTGGPATTLTLKGFTLADLGNGRLNVSFGAASGENYLSIGVLK